MSLRGHVVAVISETLGSKLVADAAAGATSLVVEYAGDFEDSGTLDLNGARLAYSSWTSGELEDDPDTITLAAPLAEAASEGDVVGVATAGATAVDVVARVTLGDGDAVDVTLPFEQRPLWPVGDYDPPVPVEVSDDLMRLVSVPYREAMVDGGSVWNPYSIRRMSVATIPTGTWTTLTAWENVESDLVTDGDGWTIVYPAVYLIGMQIVFSPNATGRRAVRLILNGDTTNPISVGGANADTGAGNPTYVSAFTQLRLVKDDVLTVQVFQSSGANLTLYTSAGRGTSFINRVSV